MNDTKNISIYGINFYVFSPKTNLDNTWDDIEQGLWEPQTFWIIDNILNENDCALELGVDLAQTSLFTAAKVGKFLAVEPSLPAITFARQLFELNPELEIKSSLVHGALSYSYEKVLFGRGSNLFDEIHFIGDNPNIYIDAYLIEDLQKMVAERISFINMDIEGGEYICLSRMYTWLRQNKPKLLLSIHPGFLLTPNQKGKSLLFRYINRIFRQRIIFLSIWFYPYIYDAVTLRRISPFSIFNMKYIRSKSAHNSQILCMPYRLTTCK